MNGLEAVVKLDALRDQVSALELALSRLKDDREFSSESDLIREMISELCAEADRLQDKLRSVQL